MPEEFQASEPMLELPNATPADHARHIGAGEEMGPGHYVHCRDLHGEDGCSLTMSGDLKDVIRAAVEHANIWHGQADTPDLAERVRHVIRRR